MVAQHARRSQPQRAAAIVTAPDAGIESALSEVLDPAVWESVRHYTRGVVRGTAMLMVRDLVRAAVREAVRELMPEVQREMRVYADNLMATSRERGAHVNGKR